MKHHSIRRYLIVLLTLGFMVVPALAAADTIQYIERRWTGTAVESETKMKTDVAEFPESTSVAEGIYVVKQNRTINGRVSLVGDTEIILMDHCTLNVKGLYIPEGSTLTIYAQSDGKNAGKIISKPSDGTGIGAYAGSDHKGGEIVIHGGMIEATGGKHCAGIGSNDDNGTTSPITIYGGTITAKGGEDGAGIGGGRKCDGGTIIAKGGGENGAGIGGGDDGDGGTIEIYGGTITANPDPNEDGAGIGGGDAGDGGTITITGGKIYTHPQGQGNGAGIGGGNNGGAGGTITITGGYVNAVSKHGAGIGGGQEEKYYQFPENSGAGAKLTITGGEVHATSTYAFGIGCGGAWYEDDLYDRVIGPDINAELYGTAGTITISGENTKVYATGAQAGIGGDSGSLTITGGEVHAEGGTINGKRTGHGIHMDASSSRISIHGGTVYANGYDGEEREETSPYLGEVYAGISTEASSVEINGGKVFASAQDGPGIGGIEGDGSMHGSLLISGSNTIVHASSNNNAGIGCSDWNNEKAKWTFEREATIEVTSGGKSDKLKKNSVPINEVGAKITAGSSQNSAKLLTVTEKETAHRTYQYRRIELCTHDQEQSGGNLRCAFCGEERGHCYISYEVDGNPAHTVSTMVLINSYITPPETPDRPGYEFKYWYEVTGAEDTVAGSAFDFKKRVGKDLILRAKWVHKHDNGTAFDPWYSDRSLPANAGNYYLTRNVTLAEGWTWSGGTLNLCLDGKTIFGNDVSGSVLSVAGGKLNLYDEGDGAVTQTDGKADTIHVAAGSVFSLYGARSPALWILTAAWRRTAASIWRAAPSAGMTGAYW